jgi:CheY-like chemotaxis protein
MSKIEAKKFELSLTEFDFKEMIHRVVNIVNCRFEEKDQRFQVHIDESIPDILIGDDQRLAQVITNLLSNAAKFTPKQGDIELSITSLEKTEEYCTIQVSVTDTGIGISANQQESLFEAFKQAESGISRKYGGTGLGLPISKNIVEMMGGNVWIDSELGQGATFAFKISLKLGMADTIQLSEVDEDIKISEAFCGKRVLLAEDLEINYEIIKSLLEPTHLNIDWAENGVEAVQMFNESQGMYDIVLMDVHMPMMDGYEATRLIRSSNVPRAKTIPIIAMTANVFREDIERCIESGMSDHLGKPIDYKAVITKLHDYLLTEKQSRIAS